MTGPELLKHHPFARGLSDRQLATLLACGREQHFPEGALLLREGDDAGAVFLLLRGRVVLEQHVPGKGGLQLETLAAGDLLGVSWLFPGSHWLLDARTAEATDALVLDGRCVLTLMDSDAGLGLALSRYIIHQLYQRLERVRLQRLDVYRGKA